MEKVIIFGAGVQGKKILNEVKEKYDVILLIDNDPKKDNTSYEDIPIKNLSKELLDKTEYDAIIIGTLSGYRSIVRQLISLNVPSMKIITSWVENQTVAREKFVETLASMFAEMNTEGNIAEGGVFQGEFSAIMNKAFPLKKLYLFDTFEGFDEKDIVHERDYSKARVGDYSITSEEVVMKKMTNPNNVIIRKGFFPETAEDISDEFCFVNLDFDLYNPTKNGLELFEKKMVSGGVILVHDYFSNQYKGVKEAVDEFVLDRSSLRKIPIGDSISIAIVGF